MFSVFCVNLFYQKPFAVSLTSFCGDLHKSLLHSENGNRHLGAAKKPAENVQRAKIIAQGSEICRVNNLSEIESINNQSENVQSEANKLN